MEFCYEDTVEGFSMKWSPEKSARTARARKKPSKPLEILMKKRKIPKKAKILDYGCGKGADVKYLQSKGYHVKGWDPFQPGWNDPSVLSKRYDIVLNFYVLNVLPSVERRRVLRGIKKVLKRGGKAYIAVRDVSEPKLRGTPFDDRMLTSTGTFQKFFTPHELEELLSREFKHVKILSKRQPLLAEVW